MYMCTNCSDMNCPAGENPGLVCKLDLGTLREKEKRRLILQYAETRYYLDRIEDLIVSSGLLTRDELDALGIEGEAK